MDCMYNEVDGWEGVGWVGSQRLYLPIGLYEASISPRSAIHWPRQA